MPFDLASRKVQGLVYLGRICTSAAFPIEQQGRRRLLGIPFRRRISMGIGQSGLSVQTAHSGEVVHYSVQGRVVGKWRIRSARPIPASLRREVHDSIIASNARSEILADYRRLLDDPSQETTLPAFSEMLVDNDGNVWLREYDRQDAIDPGESAADAERRWFVFSAAGRLISHVVTPARFRPMYIGRDEPLGVWFDQDDVEHVRAYSLRKP